MDYGRSLAVKLVVKRLRRISKGLPNKQRVGFMPTFSRIGNVAERHLCKEVLSG